MNDLNINEPDDSQGLTLETFTCYFREIDQQPAWRAKADREMDYFDGNQLDSEVLQKQAAIGMPPAIEPLIGPALEAVHGMEVKTRTDWRVTPDSDKSGDDVAAALNHKLNQAERQSKADLACTDAFKTQSGVGIGWVEVSKESDPFKYPYRAKAVHRNEIWWDFLSVEPDLSDARYLIRRRWTDKTQVALKWPDKALLIRGAANRWFGLEDITLDGGGMTGLAMAREEERGWSIEEQQWRDIENKRVCLFEVWYRVWVSTTVISTPDGRIVEYDSGNDAHNAAIATGIIKPRRVVISKMRVSFWMGPHKLSDEPSPYRHNKFPYAPFWGKREDRTRTPYGLIRGMMYQQDNVNATQSKIRWGLSAVRTTRTKGAVVGEDEDFRQNIARIDADVILDAAHMATPGAMFKVERDFQLSSEQYKMLQDSRQGILRTGGITEGLSGQHGSATSGVQEQTQVEQATQALANLMGNFRNGRTLVGELLLSMIIQDSIGKPETVTIDGGGLKPDRVIMLNQSMTDDDGIVYLDNDVSRTQLKVALNDVPSTPSFRSQQLSALSEAVKSMPQNLQMIVLPHLMSLMDVPNRDDIIDAIQRAAQQETPEQIQKRIDEAVKTALAQSGAELKARELDLKYHPDMVEAQVRKLVAEAFKINGDAIYSANQTAASIVANPQIAPITDMVVVAAGYQAPNPGGVDPNLPVPTGVAPAVPVDQPGVVPNTSPAMPPVPQRPQGSMAGIETLRTSDNEGALTSAPI
ncbi:portal protein [Variovorax boronicumulans]|uniref:portal protein n=1 Tax=Variovorax boronicumulans TaxID=436515 RepID=UPI0012E59E52|nr:hypothetical protein [Variovorax boronicumulans]GER16688.1 hypothetical protein VCH24_16940 [Variovorax boronicumulans]